MSHGRGGRPGRTIGERVETTATEEPQDVDPAAKTEQPELFAPGFEPNGPPPPSAIPCARPSSNTVEGEDTQAAIAREILDVYARTKGLLERVKNRDTDLGDHLALVGFDDDYEADSVHDLTDHPQVEVDDLTSILEGFLMRLVDDVTMIRARDPKARALLCRAATRATYAHKEISYAAESEALRNLIAMFRESGGEDNEHVVLCVERNGARLEEIVHVPRGMLDEAFRALEFYWRSPR